MIAQEDFLAIQKLHALGYSISQIARELGLSVLRLAGAQNIVAAPLRLEPSPGAPPDRLRSRLAGPPAR